MKIPIIGVTTRHDLTRAGLPAVMVQQAYINAIIEAGGAPILIPSDLPQDAWQALLQRLDGILYTGGGDIETEIFHGQDHPKVDGVDRSRDRLELGLFRSVIDERKPFLGICRGFQVANVALGGTLYTHIMDQHSGALQHEWGEVQPRNYLAHPVKVEEDSRIAKIFGEPILQVNSLHHQGIKGLAPGLKAVAFAPDGLIEAVEKDDQPFCFAVQWHPEWLTDQEPMRRLFQAFIRASDGRKDD